MKIDLLTIRTIDKPPPRLQSYLSKENMYGLSWNDFHLAFTWALSEPRQIHRLTFPGFRLLLGKKGFLSKNQIDLI